MALRWMASLIAVVVLPDPEGPEMRTSLTLRLH